MITLGITGRSGCGKSTVTAVFSAHGVPLADADQISREMLLPSSPLLPVLARRFGADILRADGSLDRRLLADRAFAVPEGKAALDAITHPEIVRRIRLAKHAAEEAGASLFVLDGAVIVGTEAEAECDRLAVVTAPFETSVARIAKRDGIAPRRPKKPCWPAPITSCATTQTLPHWKRLRTRFASSCWRKAARKVVRDPRFECEEIFEGLRSGVSDDAGHPLPAAGADAGGKNALSLQIFRPCGAVRCRVRPRPATPSFVRRAALTRMLHPASRPAA